jgi:hypothetical protein
MKQSVPFACPISTVSTCFAEVALLPPNRFLTCRLHIPMDAHYTFCILVVWATRPCTYNALSVLILTAPYLWNQDIENFSFGSFVFEFASIFDLFLCATLLVLSLLG